MDLFVRLYDAKYSVMYETKDCDVRLDGEGCDLNAFLEDAKGKVKERYTPSAHPPLRRNLRQSPRRKLSLLLLQSEAGGEGERQGDLEEDDKAGKGKGRSRARASTAARTTAAGVTPPPTGRAIPTAGMTTLEIGMN